MYQAGLGQLFELRMYYAAGINSKLHQECGCHLIDTEAECKLLLTCTVFLSVYVIDHLTRSALSHNLLNTPSQLHQLFNLAHEMRMMVKKSGTSDQLKVTSLI